MEALRRALGDKVFWLIAVTAVLGYFEQSPWVIAPLSALVTLWSVVSEPHWLDRFRNAGALPALGLFWVGCLGQNVLAVGAAFVLGHGARWLWD